MSCHQPDGFHDDSDSAGVFGPRSSLGLTWCLQREKREQTSSRGLSHVVANKDHNSAARSLVLAYMQQKNTAKERIKRSRTTIMAVEVTELTRGVSSSEGDVSDGCSCRARKTTPPSGKPSNTSCSWSKRDIICYCRSLSLSRTVLVLERLGCCCCCCSELFRESICEELLHTV